MRWFLLLTSYLLITSCYVYAPNFNYRVATVQEIKTNYSPTEISTPRTNMAGKVTIKCSKEIPTFNTKMPRRPTQEELEAAVDHKAVDLLLVTYINSLKDYIIKQKAFYDNVLKTLPDC